MQKIDGTFFTPEDALAYVQERGVVLESAKGSASSLVEAIAGHPFSGSWWALPEGKRVYAVLRAVTDSQDVLRCRLLNGKITLVHRRLWPAFVRLAERFSAAQLSQLRDEHSASGGHVVRSVAFPNWVPESIRQAAAGLSEESALAVFGAWVN